MGAEPPPGIDGIDLASLVVPLLKNPDLLSQIFTSEMHHITEYNGLVDWETLVRDTEVGGEYLLRLYGGLVIPDRVKDFPSVLGRHRAQDGVPLDAMRRAMRVGHQVLIRIVAAHAGPDRQGDVVEFSMRAWDHHADYTERVTLAYLAESHRLARDTVKEQRELLTLLAASDGHDNSAAEQLAAVAGIAVDGDYLSLTMAVAARSDIMDLAARVRKRGFATLTWSSDLDETLIVACAKEPARLLSVIDDAPVGMSPIVVGLRAAPRAVRLSTALARVRPADWVGPFTLLEGWPAVVSAAHPEVSTALSSGVFRDLDRIPRAERDNILVTVSTFLRAGGVSKTAAQLFVHRNTVLNRLRRFTELTGLDFDVPGDAATVLVALRIPLAPSRDGGLWWSD